MNKYQQYSKNIITPKPGEILKTYGVEYIHNPELKGNKPLYHPFLVLFKLNGKYISLKLSSKCGHFSSNCRISVDDYPSNEVIVKDSFIDTKSIYELNKENFIQRGISLSSKDFKRVYNLMMKAYCSFDTNISPAIAKMVFKKYMDHKHVGVGSLLKLPGIEESYLILEEFEDSYRCMPFYRELDGVMDDIVNINGYNSFVNYSEEKILPKKMIFYILAYDIGPGKIDEINYKRANNYTLNLTK